MDLLNALVIQGLAANHPLASLGSFALVAVPMFVLMAAILLVYGWVTKCRMRRR